MFWLGLLLAVLAVGAACWAIGGPWATHGGLDGAHSTAFWWPWVCAMAPWCTPFLTWRMRRRFELLGPRAGLPTRWQASEWLALRLLSALLIGVLGLVLGLLFGLSARFVLLCLLGGVGCGFVWPEQRLRRRAAARRASMLRELPFMLDLMTLCVEAGHGLSTALQQVAAHAPDGPLRQSLRDAAALGRTGMLRAQWLEQWAQWADVPGVRNLVLALGQADRLGMSLGPLLRAQASQQRSERFLRAEQMALEAPVKMLFPMVLCIFPCTFLVIGFPIMVKLWDAGF